MAGATALGVLVLMSCAAWALATDYTVGDSNGWNLRINYSEWTSSDLFVVGDRLVFNYQTPQHNVVEVSASAYSSCSSSNAISIYNNGATTICGIDSHCNSGMKLEIDVTSSTPAPPSSSGTPPSNTGNNSAAGRPSPAHATVVLVGLMMLKHIF